MSADTVPDKTSLSYLVREPKNKSGTPPLLVLLHGVGSNEGDLFSLAEFIPDKFLVVSARAPITLGPSRFAWYQVDFSTGKPVFNEEQEKTSRGIILDFINELRSYHSFDVGNVYLAGFSQGGIMSYSVALTNPERFKGIAVMSGRLLEEIKPVITPSAYLSELRMFISHGTQDTTLPVQYARQALTYLKSLHLNPGYKEYNEGHGINSEMRSDFVAWLSNV